MHISAIPSPAIPPSFVVGVPPFPPHALPDALPACDEIVTVALPLGAAPLSVTFAGNTAHPGISVPAPCTVQLSETTPANPPVAVANTVIVFPLVAPAAIVTELPLVPIVKPPVVAVAAAAPPAFTAAASSFAPSTEPQPVASSNPAPTWYPDSPPVSPAADGVLLLHIEGTLTEQPETPLVPSVTSWNTLGELAASRYSSGFTLPAADPVAVFISATIAAIPGAAALVPPNTSNSLFEQSPPAYARHATYPSCDAEFKLTSGTSRLPSCGTPAPVCQLGFATYWLAPPPVPTAWYVVPTVGSFHAPSGMYPVAELSPLPFCALQ